MWIALAVTSLVWIHPLLWTVLPSGLTLYLLAEGYPARLVLVLVVPLAIVTASSQVLAAWSDVPTWVAFATYTGACAYFSLLVVSPNRDRLVARFPRALLGERFEARLAWARFEESLVAANAVVRQTTETADRTTGRTALHGLATDARREARRPGDWADAWAAEAAWLEAVERCAGAESADEQVRQVRDQLSRLDEAHLRAIERTSALDAA